jgi:hypothetical protein
MGKSIFMCTPGELVARKSDGQIFEFMRIASGSMIIIRDPFDDASRELTVSGMDFEVYILGDQSDPREVNDDLKNHAIDILAREVVNLKDQIEQMHYNMADGWGESDQAKLEEIQGKLYDCQNGIKSIYEKM